MIRRCSMDLMDMDPGELLGLEGLAGLAQFQQEGLLDVPSIGDLPELSGIEASDMGSLLQQFEEASQSLVESDNLSQPSLNSNRQSSPARMPQSVPASSTTLLDTDIFTNENEENTTPSKNVLDKIRAGTKRKSTIMLPMGMPAKRGRGRAMAMPANCAPLKLQRIMVQNLPAATANSSGNPATFKGISLLPANLFTATATTGDNGDNAAEEVVSKEDLPSKKDVSQEESSSKKEEDKFAVNDDYFDGICDHDYCQNVPPKITVTESVIEEVAEEVVVVDSEDKDVVTVDIEVDEDVDELLEKAVSDDLKKNSVVTSNETRRSRCSAFVEILKRANIGKRNYRKHTTDSTESPKGEEKYFDKIPAYYTALSIPNKAAKKAKEVAYRRTASGRRGITVEDYFARNPSPPRDPSVHNKLPAYYSCFTNSTRYDTPVDSGGDKGPSNESSQDSNKMCSSGYSSRSQTPSLVIDSRKCSRSPSVASSRSRSRSRSQSQETVRSEKKRSWRRERRSSYSSASGASSSRSRSRSPSRSRSSSSGYSCLSRSRSRSRSYSRSRSRSYSRERTHSQERRRQEQKELREEERNKQMDERRIMYVGRIPNNFTRKDMRDRFERFGEVEHVQLHFREHGDNYGFVTFSYTCDAYAAIEKGNKIPDEPNFDLCFGGRRKFCETEYEDLDGDMEMIEEFSPLQTLNNSQPLDFDQLLQQAKKKLSKPS